MSECKHDGGECGTGGYCDKCYHEEVIMSDSVQKQAIYCTFCGADDTMRNQMIKTECATICDECVLLCVKLLVKPKNTDVTPES